MSEEPVAGRLYESDVGVQKATGRPCMRLMDGVKKMCSACSLELSDAMAN